MTESEVALPAHYEVTRTRKDLRLKRSSGLERRCSLKIAEWFGSHDLDWAPQSTDFHAISQNVDGDPILRMDRKAPPVRTRAIALQPDYAASCWSSEGNLLYRNFFLDSRFVAGIFLELFDRECQPGDILEVDMCPDVATNELLDLCALECLGDGDISQLKLDGWAVVLTEKILRTQSAYADCFVERPVHELDARRQADLVAYIEAHLEDALTLETLAKVARMDVYQLSRAFKAATGKTPYRYVLERRVARARVLLATGNDAIANIAYQCGFSSQQHMTGTFSKVLGVTPAKYRRDRQD